MENEEAKPVEKDKDNAKETQQEVVGEGQDDTTTDAGTLKRNLGNINLLEDQNANKKEESGGN